MVKVITEKCFKWCWILAFLSMPMRLSAQEKDAVSEVDQKFSDPSAPVGMRELTVPKQVRPILDIWMRDAFVMLGPDGIYYLTGTTASPERSFGGGAPHCWDYNDGIYLWKSHDLKSWQKIGLIWSFDQDAAPWQKKGKPVLAGAKSVNNDELDSLYRAVWAPEIHYIQSRKKWMIVACLNGGNGSFILESTSGKPEGPYQNIKGNVSKPIFNQIDASLFEDDNGEVYVVGHNHFIAKMKPDLSDLSEPFQRFKETPYSPEPYIEGVYLAKHNGKYQLMQTVWSVPKKNGGYTYLQNTANPRSVYSYDVVVSESTNIYGPYGTRYPAILEGGHNNLFKDKNGGLWSSTFFNPRGERGAQYNPTCRPAIVPVDWIDGKLRPDSSRAELFYSK